MVMSLLYGQHMYNSNKLDYQVTLWSNSYR